MNKNASNMGSSKKKYEFQYKSHGNNNIQNRKPKIVHQNMSKKYYKPKSHISINPKNPNFSSPDWNLLNDTIIPSITIVVSILIFLNIVFFQAVFVAQLISTIYLIGVLRNKFLQFYGSLL